MLTMICTYNNVNMVFRYTDLIFAFLRSKYTDAHLFFNLKAKALDKPPVTVDQGHLGYRGTVMDSSATVGTSALIPQYPMPGMPPLFPAPFPEPGNSSMLDNMWSQSLDNSLDGSMRQAMSEGRMLLPPLFPIPSHQPVHGFTDPEMTDMYAASQPAPGSSTGFPVPPLSTGNPVSERSDGARQTTAPGSESEVTAPGKRPRRGKPNASTAAGKKRAA